MPPVYLSTKSVAILALALLFPQSSQPRVPTPPTGAVSQLQFAWPEGTVALVEAEHTSEQEGTSGPMVSSRRARYRMQVLPHREGQLIRFSDCELEPSTAAGSADPAELFLDWFCSATLIVDKEGRFVRVEDVAEALAALDTMVEQLRKQAGSVPPAAKAFIANTTSEASLAHFAAQQWEDMAGAWIALPLTSEKFDLELERRSAGLRVKTISKGSVRMLATAECSRAGEIHICATFERILRMDMEPIFRFLEGVAPERDKGFFASAKADHVEVVRVTVETQTLLPHEFSMVTTSRLVTPQASGAARTTVTVRRKTARFVYLPAKQP